MPQDEPRGQVHEWHARLSGERGAARTRSDRADSVSPISVAVAGDPERTPARTPPSRDRPEHALRLLAASIAPAQESARG